MSSPVSAAVCPGCRQPLPANLAAGPPQLQCLACGSIFPNPLTPSADPHGTYGQQFGRNPLGTYFFGPQLDAYRGHADPAQYGLRRTQFRRWLLGLAATFVVAIIVPFPLGLLGANLTVALSAVVYSLFFCGVWGIAYGFGLMMYGGALFEKPWLMNSKRAREKRAMWGDSSARNTYLILGRIVMVIAACISIGNTMMSGLALLAFRLQETAKAREQAQHQRDAGEQSDLYREPTVLHIPAAQGAEKAERVEILVGEGRQKLEKEAAALRVTVKEYQAAEAATKQNPGDLALRSAHLAHKRKLSTDLSSYLQHVFHWKRYVEQVRKAAADDAAAIEVLERHQKLPPEMDFSAVEALVAADEFPYPVVASLEERLEPELPKFEAWRKDKSKIPADVSFGTRLALEGDVAQLEEIERKFGYRSRVLDQLPSSRQLKPDDPGSKPPKEFVWKEPPPKIVPSSSILPPGFVPKERSRRYLGDPRKLIPDPLDESDCVLFGQAEVSRSDKTARLSLTGNQNGALFKFPGLIFANYAVDMRVTRVAGKGPFVLCLPVGRQEPRPVAVVYLDAAASGELRSGLAELNGAAINEESRASSSYRGELFPLGKPVDVRCLADEFGLTLEIDGKVVYEWNGDAKTLSAPAEYRAIKQAKVCVGCRDSTFVVENPVHHLRPAPRP